MKRNRIRILWIPPTLWLGVTLALGADPDPRQSYRFTVKSSGFREVEFRGLLTVDGSTRFLPRQTTPFEFRCEAGSVITGYLEIMSPGRELNLKVFDPSYSRRRPAASGRGFEQVRFAWAKPGVGPRCIDFGEGACPETVPGVDHLKRFLESKR